MICLRVAQDVVVRVFTSLAEKTSFGISIWRDFKIDCLEHFRVSRKTTLQHFYVSWSCS